MGGSCPHKNMPPKLGAGALAILCNIIRWYLFWILSNEQAWTHSLSSDTISISANESLDRMGHMTVNTFLMLFQFELHAWYLSEKKMASD